MVTIPRAQPWVILSHDSCSSKLKNPEYETVKFGHHRNYMYLYENIY